MLGISGRLGNRRDRRPARQVHWAGRPALDLGALSATDKGSRRGNRRWQGGRDGAKAVCIGSFLATGGTHGLDLRKIDALLLWPPSTNLRRCPDRRGHVRELTLSWGLAGFAPFGD